MSRNYPAVLFGFFVAVTAIMCATVLMKGGLYINRHEGDTFHLIQILFRMADGQWPHLDFMTPIGVLAFAPMALFLKLGYGVGMSILLGQALVSAIFLPAAWWVAYSRMSGVLPYLFGLVVMVLFSAVMYGQAEQGVSVSMHYNRWAWAISFIALATVVFPARHAENAKVDGVVLGLCLSVLALTKITYFAAFIVPVMVALLLRRAFGALFFAFLTGLVVVAIVTALAGVSFWFAYLNDILNVSISAVRPRPSANFGAVVGAPAYIAASLTLMGGVVLLRQAREEIAGVILLLLVPAFFYVAYQNYGNDPQWLLLLGVIMIGFQPLLDLRNGFGWDLRNAMKVAAGISFALAAPSFFNLAYSPFRHFGADPAQYTALLPDSDVNTDLQTYAPRAYRVNATIAMNGAGWGLPAYEDLAQRDAPTIFKGETLPYCQSDTGLVAWFKYVSDDLTAAGLADGTRVFSADILSAYWLYGSMLPLIDGAPWYYDGLPGFQSADYLLVPMCPIAPKVRHNILQNVERSGFSFSEIRRTKTYILYQKNGPSG